MEARAGKVLGQKSGWCPGCERVADLLNVMISKNRKFTMVRFAIIIMPICILLAVLSFIFIDQMNIVILRSKGDISTGSIFGIDSRMSLAAAHKRLLAFDGLSLVDVERESRCQGIYFDKQYEFSHFYDRSWRHGMICAISSNRRIKRIIWQYTFAMPP